MKAIKKSLAVLASVVTLSGCMGEFGDINVNPNQPSDEYTDMLFTMSAKYVRNFIMTSSSFDPWMQEYSGYLAEAKNNQYGPLGATVNFNSNAYYYNAIKNLNSIIRLNTDEATSGLTSTGKLGSADNQIAVARTLRAFFYMSLSDIYGPIVYSEAFQGDEGNWDPVYDSQEFVYESLDADLQEAYTMFDPNGKLSTSADILYGGDVNKWKKFNASLRMMMAIKLADVDPAAGKTRFAKAYADGAMSDNADSFTYTFDTNAKSWFYSIGSPLYSSPSYYFGPNKVIVDYLKAHQDPRLFRYTTLDGYLGKREGDTYDFSAYEGIRFGLENNNAVNEDKNLSASVHYRYCEPEATYGVITYARTLLVEAEAAVLGWINADAESLYNAGIAASFEFEGVDTIAGSKDAAGNVCASIDEYLEYDAVKFASSKEEQLRQIFTQRFLAGFLCDGVESWSDWRRSNIPDIPMYKGQIQQGYTSYPCRMSYDNDHRQYNPDSYKVMNDTYFGGKEGDKDGRWMRVWWDVADNTCPDGTAE